MQHWPTAIAALKRQDPVLGGIIDRHGGLTFQTRGDPFATLVRSIVGQQISNLAAGAIWKRLQTAVPMTPEGVLAVPPDLLRAQGLSGRKVDYIRDVARYFATHPDLETQLAGLPDEVIIRELTTIRGIGRWTVEMFLIFNLMRPDVLPLDDLGLQRAVAIHYLDGRMPQKKELISIAEAWQPWRSVATWYLWRSLEANPIVY